MFDAGSLFVSFGVSELFFNAEVIIEPNRHVYCCTLGMPPGTSDFIENGWFDPVLIQSCCHTKDKTYSAMICLKRSGAFFWFHI
jgi:hypothetical protein